jgi:hypothetical protein
MEMRLDIMSSQHVFLVNHPRGEGHVLHPERMVRLSC